MSSSAHRKPTRRVLVQIDNNARSQGGGESKSPIVDRNTNHVKRNHRSAQDPHRNSLPLKETCHDDASLPIASAGTSGKKFHGRGRDAIALNNKASGSATKESLQVDNGALMTDLVVSAHNHNRPKDDEARRDEPRSSEQAADQRENEEEQNDEDLEYVESSLLPLSTARSGNVSRDMLKGPDASQKRETFSPTSSHTSSNKENDPRYLSHSAYPTRRVHRQPFDRELMNRSTPLQLTSRQPLALLNKHERECSPQGPPQVRPEDSPATRKRKEEAIKEYDRRLDLLSSDEGEDDPKVFTTGIKRAGDISVKAPVNSTGSGGKLRLPHLTSSNTQTFQQSRVFEELKRRDVKQANSRANVARLLSGPKGLSSDPPKEEYIDWHAPTGLAVEVGQMAPGNDLFGFRVAERKIKAFHNEKKMDYGAESAATDQPQGAHDESPSPAPVDKSSVTGSAHQPGIPVTVVEDSPAESDANVQASSDIHPGEGDGKTKEEDAEISLHRVRKTFTLTDKKVRRNAPRTSRKLGTSKDEGVFSSSSSVTDTDSIYNVSASSEIDSFDLSLFPPRSNKERVLEFDTSTKVPQKRLRKSQTLDDRLRWMPKRRNTSSESIITRTSSGKSSKSSAVIDDSTEGLGQKIKARRVKKGVLTREGKSLDPSNTFSSTTKGKENKNRSGRKLAVHKDKEIINEGKGGKTAGRSRPPSGTKMAAKKSLEEVAKQEQKIGEADKVNDDVSGDDEDLGPNKRGKEERSSSPNNATGHQERQDHFEEVDAYKLKSEYVM